MQTVCRAVTIQLVVCMCIEHEDFSPLLGHIVTLHHAAFIAKGMAAQPAVFSGSESLLRKCWKWAIPC